MYTYTQTHQIIYIIYGWILYTNYISIKLGENVMGVNSSIFYILKI